MPYTLLAQKLADALDEPIARHVMLLLDAQVLDPHDAGVALPGAEDRGERDPAADRVLELLAELVVAAVDLDVEPGRAQLGGQRGVRGAEARLDAQHADLRHGGG